MPICNNCDAEFPNWVKVDGVSRNLASRKYCLTCSPFGQHNTRPFVDGKTQPTTHRCACGETDPIKFYGRKKHRCGKCCNAYSIKRMQDMKVRSVEYKGGKCMQCGYSKSMVALDFHHMDPANTDPNFGSWRGWTWKKLKPELDQCLLLCSNCHRETHEHDADLN